MLTDDSHVKPYLIPKLLACLVIFHALVVVCLLFFSKLYFQKILSGMLSKCPDLCPNCLQRLSADDKSLPLARIELRTRQNLKMFSGANIQLENAEGLL